MANDKIEAKLKKLRFSRARLLSDLKHTIGAAKALTAGCKPILVVCKDRTLERYWTEFQANLDAIVTITEAMEDEETFFVENQAIEDEYHDAKVHLDSIMPAQDDGDLSLDRSFIGGNQNASEGNVSAGGNNNEATPRMHRSHLPDIKVQPFDGNYDNWNRFSQMFSKLVAKERFDPIDKLYYLNQSLTGEPQQLVKHLPVTEDSFEQAWKLLTKNLRSASSHSQCTV